MPLAEKVRNSRFLKWLAEKETQPAALMGISCSGALWAGGEAA